jgi:hypothetical protein
MQRVAWLVAWLFVHRNRPRTSNIVHEALVVQSHDDEGECRFSRPLNASNKCPVWDRDTVFGQKRGFVSWCGRRMKEAALVVVFHPIARWTVTLLVTTVYEKIWANGAIAIADLMSCGGDLHTSAVDHTFNGVMFDVSAGDSKPLDYVVVESVRYSLRGARAPYPTLPPSSFRLSPLGQAQTRSQTLTFQSSCAACPAPHRARIAPHRICTAQLLAGLGARRTWTDDRLRHKKSRVVPSCPRRTKGTSAVHNSSRPPLPLFLPCILGHSPSWWVFAHLTCHVCATSPPDVRRILHR